MHLIIDYLKNARQIPWLHSCYTNGSRDVDSVAIAAEVFPHQTPQFSCDCLIQHPDLLLQFGKSLKPWNKLKILMHYVEVSDILETSSNSFSSWQWQQQE